MTGINAISSIGADALRFTSSAQGEFDAVLAQASSTEDQARDAASQLVATAFILPVLETLRQSEFAAEPFAPNSAEKRFAPQLDYRIAERLTEAANFPLIDVLAERLTGVATEKGGVDVHG